jgi:hypothetical protein
VSRPASALVLTAAVTREQRESNGVNSLRLIAKRASRWQFEGDKQAAKMFVGKDCSLCTNPNWDTASKRLQ